MKVTLAAVGRARDSPVRTLVDDYARRLPWPFTLREIADAAGDKRREREGEKLLAAIPEGALIVALDSRGRQLSSEALADWLGRKRDEGCRELALVIGGADGLSPEVIQRAGMILSLGTMTWPHLMVRAMLAEQLYRASTILAGHPYHSGHA
jgi:23S rRNA (pseudouridine1915-N3)-methyltransferase